MWQVVIIRTPGEGFSGASVHRVIGTDSTAWEAFCLLKDADIREVQESDNLLAIVVAPTLEP